MRFDKAEQYRLKMSPSNPWHSRYKDRYGAFQLKGPCGRDLRIIASDYSEDVPWEHVSVSTPNRTPNWAEMCFVKDLFWDKEDAVVQFHPPESQYINNHQYCLHLWKPVLVELQLPPMEAVGYKDLNLR